MSKKKTWTELREQRSGRAAVRAGYEEARRAYERSLHTRRQRPRRNEPGRQRALQHDLRHLGSLDEGSPLVILNDLERPRGIQNGVFAEPQVNPVRVASGTAEQEVIARSTIEIVVALASDQRIFPASADEVVISPAANQHVVTRFAVERRGHVDLLRHEWVPLTFLPGVLLTRLGDFTINVKGWSPRSYPRARSTALASVRL